MTNPLAYWQNRLHYHLWHLQARLRLFKGALILSYHSVSDHSLNPLGLNVSPQHFAEHLEVLKTHFELVPLSEILQRLSQQKNLHALVALTFDDGYANNFHTVLPLLEKYQVPATIFIVSGAIAGTAPFYWEVLAQKLLDANEESKRPDRLQVPYRRGSLNYSLRTPAECLRAYHKLRSLLTGLYGEERLRLLEEILKALGGHTVPSDYTRPLTINELQRMAQSSLISIGSHTVSHPRLDRLPFSLAWEEIVTARRQIAEWTGQEVRSFAYPYGYGGIKLRLLVREAGYEAACSTKAGGVRTGSDPFALPRLHVGNWPGQQLARYLGH